MNKLEQARIEQRIKSRMQARIDDLEAEVELILEALADEKMIFRRVTEGMRARINELEKQLANQNEEAA